MGETKTTVSVFNHSAIFEFRHRKIQTFVRNILSFEGVKQSRGSTLALMLIDDEEMTSANVRFFNKNRPTDVISFPGQEDERILKNTPSGHHIGDIMVGVQTALREHVNYQTSLEYEIMFYIAHGVLHVLGHTDETDAKRQKMHNLQAKYIKQTLRQDPEADQIIRRTKTTKI